MRFVTQVALLISVPLLVARSASRRDLVALLGQPRNYWKLAVLFAVGMSGLVLFKIGLSNAHPMIISAIVNLQPFWAASCVYALAALGFLSFEIGSFAEQACGCVLFFTNHSAKMR